MKCSSCFLDLNDKNWSLANQIFKKLICKKCNNRKGQLRNTSEAVCIYCDNKLKHNNWSKAAEKHKRYICKICENLIRKERKEIKRRAQNIPKKKIYTVSQRKEASKLRTKIYNLEEKRLCFEAYGNKCNCCSIDIWQFLSIDHINNNGNIERRKNKNKTGISFYKLLKKQGYPKNNYQLLCFNCNSAKGHHGFCPHCLDKSPVCFFCKGSLSENQFLINKENKHNICKDCVARNCNLQISKIRSKKTTLELKYNIIKNYGGKCQCCNESEPYFLGIDHIYGGGNKERKKVFGRKFYIFLKDNNYPKDKYQLLCFNCNASKGSFGQCCHETQHIGIKEQKDRISNKIEQLSEY